MSQKIRIIVDYFEQSYGNKLDNLEGMENSFRSIRLPKLNQEEIERLNKPITNKETESII
jgi:hypothetical protein